jgi:hypothetical protein
MRFVETCARAVFCGRISNGSRESTIQARWIEFFVDGVEAGEWLRADTKKSASPIVGIAM